jgi:hypothetical protein
MSSRRWRYSYGPLDPTSIYDILQAIPGVIEYKGARIQLLDLPGIVEGASQGRGRGRQVVSS